MVGMAPNQWCSGLKPCLVSNKPNAEIWMGLACMSKADALAFHSATTYSVFHNLSHSVPIHLAGTHDTLCQCVHLHNGLAANWEVAELGISKPWETEDCQRQQNEVCCGLKYAIIWNTCVWIKNSFIAWNICQHVHKRAFINTCMEMNHTCKLRKR